MAAITMCSDFGAPNKQSLTLFPLSPHLFLKTPNDLKTCPTRAPGVQSASLHPERPLGLLKGNSYAARGSFSIEADSKCPVVPSLAMLLASANL